MIHLCHLDEPLPADVEFDEYVPVTLTWPEAGRLLDAPLYMRYGGSGRLLEMKFHPHSRRLVEAVLVSASRVQRDRSPLDPVSADDAATACWSERAGTGSGAHEMFALIAHDDCLVIDLANSPSTSWVGLRPVLFGLNGASEVVAISVMWDDGEREAFLAAAE